MNVWRHERKSHNRAERKEAVRRVEVRVLGWILKELLVLPGKVSTLLVQSDLFRAKPSPKGLHRDLWDVEVSHTPDHKNHGLPIHRRLVTALKQPRLALTGINPLCKPLKRPGHPHLLWKVQVHPNEVFLLPGDKLVICYLSIAAPSDERVEKLIHRLLIILKTNHALLKMLESIVWNMCSMKEVAPCGRKFSLVLDPRQNVYQE